VRGDAGIIAGTSRRARVHQSFTMNGDASVPGQTEFHESAVPRFAQKSGFGERR
jgi:hypothetical protein